jgi:hypothetical protein
LLLLQSGRLLLLCLHAKPLLLVGLKNAIKAMLAFQI